MKNQLITALISSFFVLSCHSQAFAKTNNAQESKANEYCNQFLNEAICQDNKSYIALDTRCKNFSDDPNCKNKKSEFDEYCNRFPYNHICENKESYISLYEWEEDKTACALVTEWEEKKCKIVVRDRELTIYVEQEKLSESFPNTLKTKEITISLDEVFAFNTEWWLASTGNDISRFNNLYGSFPELEIGFIQDTKNLQDSSGKFLTISSKNLHPIMEEIESWRYYLPNLIAFESRFRFDSRKIKANQSVSKNIVQLEKTNECAYCDLRNADLAGMDLEKADLQGANLAGANLEETKLKRAYLLGTNLNRANLYNVNLENANLMFATLKKADLGKANLKGANLQNSNLDNALLNDAKLNARKLENTNLKNASLINTDLSDANLQCANLQSANLTNANLTNADLNSCEQTMGGFHLSKLRLDNGNRYRNFGINNNGVEIVAGGVKLALSVLPASSVIRAISTLSLSAKTSFNLDTDLSNANLTGTNLTGTNLKQAQLTDVNFSQAIFNDTKFQANNLSNANFIDTDVEDVNFGDNPISICEATFSHELVYDEYCVEEEIGDIEADEALWQELIILLLF